MFQVCILGGGASGSILAINLAKKGIDVAVVDADEKPAKKLLVTGNGKCNLTNKNTSSKFYSCNLDRFFEKFSWRQTVQMFHDFGLLTYFDEQGRCYPTSNQAKSVCFVIQKQFEKYHINFFANQNVVDVEFQNDFYVVKTDKQIFECKTLVFATGHNKHLLDISKKLGEKTLDFVPSLVALKTKQNTKKLAGQRLSNVLVVGCCEDKKMIQFGEVLFKENGLSGICIFDISSIFAQKNKFFGKISIDLLPKIDIVDLQNVLKNNLSKFSNILDLLQGLFSKQVAEQILLQANIPPETDCNNVKEETIFQIANATKKLQFDVCGHHDNNQVCAGGILLQNLTECLESKVHKNLYFCGEICNAQGICGGYNLQWAFSSAMIVAQDILQKTKKLEKNVQSQIKKIDI